ncbi:hypothetical protein LTR95_000229 [Oleoguttula sp. CCFEE 5521]
MEPATELPCNALRIRLDTALDAFRQRVYESNYAEFKHVLEWAHTQFDPIDYDDHDDPVEDQLEARLDLVYDEYLHERQYHPIARAEFVTLVDGADIDELAEPHIDRRFVPNGTTTPPDPETLESRHQELQSKPLCSVAVPSLPELIDRLGLGSEDWIVYAGCITGTESYDNITACGLASCGKKSGGDGGDRHKAWRIFVTSNNSKADDFESFEGFLEWYCEYGRRYW